MCVHTQPCLYVYLQVYAHENVCIFAYVKAQNHTYVNGCNIITFIYIYVHIYTCRILMNQHIPNLCYFWIIWTKFRKHLHVKI